MNLNREIIEYQDMYKWLNQIVDTPYINTPELQIEKQLQLIEEENNVKVIFAVEAGSRAYGCNSETSDYDIRFVYVYNDISKYLAISNIQDSITGNCQNFLKKLDWQGWDIYKAVKHLKESNPSIMEWLNSEIHYRNNFEFKNKCNDLLSQMHSHLSLMYHYNNMAKSNWKKWIEDKKEKSIICKKYFYVIRPLASLIYIMNKYENNSDEPIVLISNFDKLLDEIRPIIEENCYNELKILIEKKRNLTEKELCYPIIQINNWIINVFEKFDNIIKKNKTKNENNTENKIQSIIKIHSKLDNEVKAIIDIMSTNGCTARSNYLTAIGTALQLIWLDLNQNNETLKIPQQIQHLLIKLDNFISDKIKTEIEKIINFMEKEEKITNALINNNDIYKYFVTPGIKCIYENSKGITNSDEILSSQKMLQELGFDSKNIDLILNSKRNDFAEITFKKYIEMLWLLCNVTSAQSNMPNNIINNGDNTETIPEQVLLDIKKTLIELRPKFIVSRNNDVDNVNMWLQHTVENFRPKVNLTRIRLSKIKEEQTQKRLNYSIKNINSENFDNIILDILKNMKILH